MDKVAVVPRTVFCLAGDWQVGKGFSLGNRKCTVAHCIIEGKESVTRSSTRVNALQLIAPSGRRYSRGDTRLATEPVPGKGILCLVMSFLGKVAPELPLEEQR